MNGGLEGGLLPGIDNYAQNLSSLIKLIMTRRRRENERFLIKVQAEVSASDRCFRGKTVRISETGIFVRSQKSFGEGTQVNIRLWLPDGRESVMKGIVRYARMANFLPRQNGMGIEFTEKDATYMQFILSLSKD